MKQRTIIASALASTTLALLAWDFSQGSRESESSPSAIQPDQSQSIRRTPAPDAMPSRHAQLASVASLDYLVTERGPDMPAIPEPGVRYARLSEQPLPDALKERLLASLQRLKETGSLSGGKVTHEFASVDDASRQLREWGLGHLLGALAIVPTNMAAALGAGYMLVGADASGKEIPGRGRAAFYQVWRSGTNQWVELAEDQLDALGGDGSVVNVDFHNENVSTHPATLESLYDKDGAALHNLQWWVKDRSFFMSTRNVDKAEAIALATRISRQFDSMAHDGWRTAYEFDPENPAHRLVRSRQHAQANVPAGPR